VDGPANLAKAAAQVGAKVIQISTDYVFNGLSNVPLKETDAIDPIGVYGRTKADGETAVLTSGADAIVIRTSWLYSTFGGNFVKTIRKYGAERGHLKVVFDQVGTPTYARDLAKACLDILSGQTKKYRPKATFTTIPTKVPYRGSILPMPSFRYRALLVPSNPSIRHNSPLLLADQITR
jgi:dTDP-4-dehydrorhamnose reductase